MEEVVVHPGKTMTEPKVFISYAWTSEEHIAWVRELAERLLSDGVDVKLDQWDLREGQDKFDFMESMVKDPTIGRVLVICDSKYKDKANKREGGVGTESTIIIPHVFSQVRQEKFLPLVREVDPEGNAIVPVFMEGRIYFNFVDEEKFYEEYERLLRTLYERPAIRKPPKGTPPAYLFEESARSIRTVHQFKAFKDALLKGKPSVLGSGRDYMDRLYPLMGEILQIQGKPIVEPDEEVLARIDQFTPYRDEYIELVSLLLKYSTPDVALLLIGGFMENTLRYSRRPEDVSCWSEWWCDPARFIIRELFLYTVTLLIKERRFEWAGQLLDRKYYFRSDEERQRLETFATFDRHIRSLDEHRKSRLGLRRLSITADLIKERLAKEFVSFDDLMQADFVLCLRSLFEYEKTGSGWYPRTLVFAEYRFSDGMPLFFRAQDSEGFEAIRLLFKVKNRAELLQKFAEADQRHQLGNWGWEFHRIEWQQLMAVKTLYAG